MKDVQHEKNIFSFLSICLDLQQKHGNFWQIIILTKTDV